MDAKAGVATTDVIEMAGRSRARTAAPAKALSHNLNGQRLGRKGRDTRDRIIAATSELLAESPVAPISLSSVARQASLGMTSLYLYFNDLTELLLAVLEPIMATAEESYVSMLRAHWEEAELGQRALEFVTAYHGFWVKHSRILHLRNSMADQQDERMLLHRVRSAQPLMRMMVEQMDGDLEAVGSPVFSMATALMTGLERVVTVTTDTALQDILHARFSSSHAHLLVAEARLLELGIRDYRTLCDRAR
ncbi:TetR/AcrR family transcriptional regulator [Sphingobium boeckii]|uniref:AcrR family transcriptional regulator n=1 Tax=Sphingobium boeckii TaxID=1082345 RepID=A0A7W9EG61_9SPHN|nr:TetR/AcrR family transcriptional regulator [Sphingobium boeckii]MBB5686750.1 AcrR family transcriptional regulator [Sphingobium boeckii]